MEKNAGLGRGREISSTLCCYEYLLLAIFLARNVYGYLTSCV